MTPALRLWTPLQAHAHLAGRLAGLTAPPLTLFCGFTGGVLSTLWHVLILAFGRALIHPAETAQQWHLEEERCMACLGECGLSELLLSSSPSEPGWQPRSMASSMSSSLRRVSAVSSTAPSPLCTPKWSILHVSSVGSCSTMLLSSHVEASSTSNRSLADPRTGIHSAPLMAGL